MSLVIVVLSFLLCSINTISQSTISTKFRNDTVSINFASTDYGHIVRDIPKAVFFPSTPKDIATLLKLANGAHEPRTVAARGQGHSVRGQAMAEKGIVVNMKSLANGGGIGIRVSPESASSVAYVDVGGEQIWIDVLVETLKHGLSPVSWTDYLYLSVGGTLSNAGMSGQNFRHGPQISNVLEMDVITGKGDMVTCSKSDGSDLFNSVLGGLGQFGIITRARIPLAPAPDRVKWVQLLYTDFSLFSKDQEYLISMKGRTDKKGVDYLEGFVLMRQGPLDLSFYPIIDQLRVSALVTRSGIVYSLELAKYYVDDGSDNVVAVKELQILFKRLSFVDGYSFEKDVTYLEFMNRVGSEEQRLRKLGLWEVAHPWLNLFVPKSQIASFDEGVFKGILLKQRVPSGLVIVYPTNRDNWDDKMSAVFPSEDVFYGVSFLHASGFGDWQAFDNVNSQILQFCRDSGLNVKQYLPHYEARGDWIQHFGSKWDRFLAMKNVFDPKRILSPGQKIFN